MVRITLYFPTYLETLDQDIKNNRFLSKAHMVPITLYFPTYLETLDQDIQY